MRETPDSFLNLESPLLGTALPAGRHILRGWLVPKRGIHFVDVRARVGTRIFAGVYGFPRADLAAHFEPSRPWLPAEFTIDVDFVSGPTEVTIEALDLRGRWIHVHAIPFSAEGTAASAGAQPDPVTAEEFGRVVRFNLNLDELPYPRIVRPDHLPFRGYLVEPAAIAPALYGQMDVVGWLFHETLPLRRVFATTDLLTFQPLQHGGQFAGVESRFPEQPHAANCRLSGFVDVSSELPAPACVRIYAELPDNSIHLCLAVHTRPVVTEELKAPHPRLTLWKFWQTWRNLKETLTRHGWRLESDQALRTEFWRTLRERQRVARPLHPRGFSAALAPVSSPAAAKLRLLLITHNLSLEGAPLLFVEYARHLAQHRGAELTVLAGQEGPLRQAFSEIGSTVRVVERSVLSAPSRAELQQRLRSIARSIAWDKIDLVVANTLTCFWGVLLAEAAHKPSLLYIHESTSPAAFFERTAPALLTAVQDAFRTATAVSFNTPATSAYYEGLGSGRNFHFNSAWIDVAAIERFRAAHTRDSLRSALGLRPDEWLVANIGSVCERKGQHDFLRAVEWLWRCQPVVAARCRFVMVGSRGTRYNRDLENRLAALGRPNLQLVPETTHAYDYFGAADLFVCTSYEESFPRVVLEAMAFDVPIVSTNVHGIPHMLRANEEAILVAPGDLNSLTQGMIRLLEDRGAAEKFARRARGRLTEFDAATLLPHHADFTARVAASTV